MCLLYLYSRIWKKADNGKGIRDRGIWGPRRETVLLNNKQPGAMLPQTKLTIVLYFVCLAMQFLSTCCISFQFIYIHNVLEIQSTQFTWVNVTIDYVRGQVHDPTHSGTPITNTRKVRHTLRAISMKCISGQINERFTADFPYDLSIQCMTYITERCHMGAFCFLKV